jgi:NADP-dependent 3-hydroxy acid dehydrogenase YdfG
MTATRTDSGAHRGAVVITGATTGIGRACALSLDALGFRVFAGVRQAEDAESLRRAGSARLTPVYLDVTDEQSISATPGWPASSTTPASPSPAPWSTCR